jgi:hypothetical protein
MSATFDRVLDDLDRQLQLGEKQVQSVLGRIRRLRKAAAAGDFALIAAQLPQLPDAAAQTAAQLSTLAESFEFDAEAALTDGSYLAELKAEAERQGVVIVETGSRLSAFPLLLRIEPKSLAIRLGRTLHKALRPTAVLAALSRAQQANRFNAPAFLEQLWRAYAALAGDWSAQSDGPVISLLAIHDLLTLHPAAAADFPREAFAADLLRLNRAPDTRTRAGLGFDLPASTGSKGRERMVVYDEQGTEHVFVGLRFLRPAA